MSLLSALLWGVAFGNIVRGVKIDANKEYVGNLLDLLNPYAILGGLVTLSLFTFHGAVFTALKTIGDIRLRARRLATVLGLVTAVLALGFLTWMQVDKGDGTSLVAMHRRPGRLADRRQDRRRRLRNRNDIAIAWPWNAAPIGIAILSSRDTQDAECDDARSLPGPPRLPSLPWLRATAPKADSGGPARPRSSCRRCCDVSPSAGTARHR